MDARYKTRRWKNLRRRIIQRDGNICSSPGCTTDMTIPYTTVVDHIISPLDGGDFWNSDNLQVLCWHHNIAKGHDATANRADPTSPNG